MTCFVTKATLMHRNLRYVCKCNKLVQLVVQVKYHVNVSYSLGGGHTHTYQLRGQKQFQETRCAPSAQVASGFKIPRLPFFYKEVQQATPHTCSFFTGSQTRQNWSQARLSFDFLLNQPYIVYIYVSVGTYILSLVKLKNQLSWHHMLCNGLRRYGIRMNASRWWLSLRRKVQPCHSFAQIWCSNKSHISSSRDLIKYPGHIRIIALPGKKWPEWLGLSGSSDPLLTLFFITRCVNYNFCWACLFSYVSRKRTIISECYIVQICNKDFFMLYR